MRNIKARLTLIIAMITTIACLSGCGSFNIEPTKEAERYSDTYYDVFDTVTTVIAYSESEAAFKEFSDALYAELEKYHELFDIYATYEGVNNARTVNKNAGVQPVAVSEEFIELMELSRRLYDETGGKVNIAMGAVLSLWHDAREYSMGNPKSAYIPDEEALKAAYLHCNMEDVIVDKDAGTVFLEDPAMSLDLGAIAKGFAIEMAVREMEARGYTDFIVSAGGNVRTSGHRSDGSNWVVAVQNPDLLSAQAYVDMVELSDASLVTSGVYRRYYEYNGKQYHHIIDPDTLMPESRFLSVSIITADSGVADALSTALFNTDLEEGRAMVEAMDGVEAMWVMPDGEIVKSSGWKSREEG